MKEPINDCARMIHAENRRWWLDLNTGESLAANQFFVPAKIMMAVTELAEAVEGHRKNSMDEKLPHRPAIEVELADALIRILDLGGGLNLDIGGAVVEKLAYNRSRADHTTEGRQAEGGKAY